MPHTHESKLFNGKYFLRSSKGKNMESLNVEEKTMESSNTSYLGFMMPGFKEAWTLLSISIFYIRLVTSQHHRMVPGHGPILFCITTINFQSDWDPGCLLPCHWADMSWLKKSINTLCPVIRCSIVLKKLVIQLIKNRFLQWWRKVSNISLYLLHCLFWGNDCRLPWSFIANPIS